MSTDTVAVAPVAAGRSVRRPWIRDLRTARILRFAFGLTAAVAVSFGLSWPLFFITPMLVAVFLALPIPAPTIRQGLDNIFYILVAFVLGLGFTLILLSYPLVYVFALGLSLFHIYYLANRGGPFFLVLMCLLAVFILPMMGLQHQALAVAFTLHFPGSAALAVVFIWLAHGVFPDPPTAYPAMAQGGFKPGYSESAAATALKSTVAIWPLATVFVVGEWTGQLLTLVFAAIFSLSPEVSKGTAAAVKSMKSTLLGGLAAVVFFFLLVAVPEFHFFIALMLFTALLFGQGIFSDKPGARYLPSAVIALVILVGSSMTEGASITDKFIGRVVLLSAATFYVVAVLSALNHFWPQREPIT